MKTIVYSTHRFEMPYLKKALFNRDATFTEEELNGHTAHLAKGYDAVSLFTSDKADGPVLEQLVAVGVRHIALRSAGFDHVDLVKAEELHITVANVPAYSPYSVAEHAVTLLLALNRKLLRSQELMQDNDFRLDELTGFDVHGKTVGIIGMGKIGECFARIMSGFGCRLLCYEPYADHKPEQELNVKFTELNELFEASDIISVHCPLNTSTKHLLNEAAFSQMKQGVFIINTARGPIINTTDAIAALSSGIIGGLGLDVYEFEKGLFFHDHRDSKKQDELLNRLRSFKNVIVTGHQAFLTQTALQNIADTTAYNLDCFEKGIDCKNKLRY